MIMSSRIQAVVLAQKADCHVDPYLIGLAMHGIAYNAADITDGPTDDIAGTLLVKSVIPAHVPRVLGLPPHVVM